MSCLFASVLAATFALSGKLETGSPVANEIAASMKWLDGTEVTCADAAVTVPHIAWSETGDASVVRRVWTNMLEGVEARAETKGGDFFGLCQWLLDIRRLREMGPVVAGRWGFYKTLVPLNVSATDYARKTYLSPDDGMLAGKLRKDPCAMMLALYLRLVRGEALERTKKEFFRSVNAKGSRIGPFFRSDEILLETLSQFGREDLAYSIVLRERKPQFAAWLWKSAAGIAADPSRAAFRNVILAPKPDRRLKSMNAELKTPAGVVKSVWRYEGAKWIWEFTVPTSSTASVTLPKSRKTRQYDGGTHRIELDLP